MSNEYIATLELAAKLAKKENAVMMACQSIPKRGAFNYGRQNWNYVTPEDLIDATAPALDTNGVRISTQITDIAVSGAQAIISFVFTVTDCETGYSEARLWTELHPVGDLKPQTMGAIKTYALKNFLYATYLVAGRDDADNLTPDNAESVQPQYNNAPRPQNDGNDKPSGANNQEPAIVAKAEVFTAGDNKIVKIDNATMFGFDALELLAINIPHDNGVYDIPPVKIRAEQNGKYWNITKIKHLGDNVMIELNGKKWRVTYDGSAPQNQ